MIFFDAKSEKICQDAIMAEQVPYFQLCFDFSTVENNDDFEEFSGEVWLVIYPVKIDLL